MADNPFSALLNPDKQGTLTGFIGGAMGNPTASQAAGGATAQALQDLSASRAEGLTPQQSLLKFFQTPAGHDFFVNAGPEGLKSLVDGMNATQAPAPAIHNVPEGGALFATNPTTGQTSQVGSNPKSYAPTALGPQDQLYDRTGNKIAENTNQKMGEVPADVRSFTFFQQIAQLPAAELKRIAGLKMDPSSADRSSVESQAIDKLVTDFGLDARTAEAMKAGQIKVLPLKNDVGQDTGAVSVVDLTNPGSPSVQVINPGQRGPAATVPNATKPLAGTTPDTGAATGVLPPTTSEISPKKPGIPESNPKYFGNKASMFLGSGPVAKGLAAASGASEMINPKMIIPEGAQAEDRQTMIDTLRSDLAAMGQLGGGIGVNKGVLEGYLKLAPTGGITESPHQAIQHAIRLSEHIDQEIEAESKVFANQKLPLEERKAAQARIQGWSRVQRDLPSHDELAKMEEAIRNGTAGAPTVSGGINTIVDAAGKALTETKRQATEVNPAIGEGQNFQSMSAEELVKVDPRSLDRTGLIQYRRRIDQLKKGMMNGSTQPASR